MNNILKKLTALITAVVMLMSSGAAVLAGVEYSVEDAYYECAEIYPDFVEKVLAQGASEREIIALLKTMQRYLLSLDVEITEENLDTYMVNAIKYAFNLQIHINVRDALVAAFPEAAYDGAFGEIHPDFVPIVETIKSIIFKHGLVGDGSDSTEPTEPTESTEPTEPSEETKPSEEPTEPSTEKPTEEATEPPTQKPTTGGGNGGNGGGIGGGNDFDDEPATEPVTEPVQRPANKTFSDMNQALWAEKAVYSLVDRGVINGYPDGTFKPNNPVTRAEFAKMIVSASGRYTTSDTYTSSFTDVPNTAWEYNYVSAALKYGFITGRSATIFDPNSNITRADLCLIVYRYIKSVNPEFKIKTNPDGTPITFSDAANVPSWDIEAVNALYSNGVASLRDTKNNKFEPTLPATRAECAQIIYNAANVALGIPVVK